MGRGRSAGPRLPADVSFRSPTASSRDSSTVVASLYAAADPGDGRYPRRRPPPLAALHGTRCPPQFARGKYGAVARSNRKRQLLRLSFSSERPSCPAHSHSHSHSHSHCALLPQSSHSPPGTALPDDATFRDAFVRFRLLCQAAAPRRGLPNGQNFQGRVPSTKRSCAWCPCLASPDSPQPVLAVNHRIAHVALMMRRISTCQRSRLFCTSLDPPHLSHGAAPPTANAADCLRRSDRDTGQHHSIAGQMAPCRSQPARPP